MKSKKMVKKLLKYSIKNKLSHIPSALSQLSYLTNILPNIDHYDWNIIIGKPFGAQAYYIIWQKMGLIPKNHKLSYGVKDTELDFVDYSEETLGNALGVASGIQLANNKRTYVNLSDAAIQMGSALEAIQFIRKHKQDILVTVDCNGTQLTGDTKDIMGIDIEYIYQLFKLNNWRVHRIEIFQDNVNEKIVQAFNELKGIGPVALIIETKKGFGVKEMEEDPVKWHYQQLRSIDEITIK